MTIVTWDSVNKGSGITLSNGNLTAVIPNSNNTVRATEGKTNGKWYWEISPTNLEGGAFIGIVEKSVDLNANTYNSPNTRGYFSHDGSKRPAVGGSTAYGAMFTISDTIGVALDLDNGTLEFYKNGVSQGVSHTNIKELGKVFPAVTSGNTTKGVSIIANFGATPFNYPVPQGYLSYEQIVNKSLILLSDGYKSYRTDITKTNENPVPHMTSNTTPYGSVSASSSLVSGGITYEGWRAFNGKVGTNDDNWFANGKASEWIQYDFEVDNKQIIWKYAITARNGNPSQTPTKFVLKASNDGEKWTVLDTKTNENNWTALERREYELSNTNSYRIYRLDVSDPQDTAQANVTIGEIEFYKILSENNWKTVSPTLPTLTQFQEEGMDDLSILARKVQQVLGSPQQMTSEVLGEGKVFKGTVDLKKLFDLRKLEVK